MTTEEKVRELRDQIAHKRASLNTFIAQGTHQKWYLQSLKTQEASMTYFQNELDKVLASTATGEPVAN